LTQPCVYIQQHWQAPLLHLSGYRRWGRSVEYTVDRESYCVRSTPPHTSYSCRPQHMGGAHTNYHYRRLAFSFAPFSPGTSSDAVGSVQSSPTSRSLGAAGRANPQPTATPRTRRARAAPRAQPRGSGGRVKISASRGLGGAADRASSDLPDEWWPPGNGEPR
jgi:hypothetical protein